MSEIRERAKEIDRLMEAYWNAAYREGVEFRIHDDEAGTAQKASAELRGFITDLLAELERVEGSVGIPIDRIAELECQKNAYQVTRKLIWENIELRTALAGVRALIHETATIIDTVEIEK